MALHRNAQRVHDALGGEVTITTLPDSAHTAADAARALGVAEAQIAKSLVFVADGTPVLAVLSGADRLDTGRLVAHLGAATAKRADPDTVRAATGYPIGGVSPAGHDGSLRILVDRRLADSPVVWAAAGTPHDVFCATFDDLCALPGAEPADVAAG